MKIVQRVNGFLDLDQYFRELSEQGIDTKNLVKESATYDDQYWLVINDKSYYFKETFSLYEELIVSECAKFLGINAVDYDLAIYKIRQGVISENYRKKGCNYISGEDILINYFMDSNNREILFDMGCDRTKIDSLNNKRDLAEYIHNLEIVWQAIEYRYQKLGININIENIMRDVITHFCLDLLVGQFDGFPQNWELEEGINGVTLMPYFDGSASFGILNAIPKPRQSLAVSFKDKGTDNYQILEAFFNTSSGEFIDLFIEKFNKLDLENFMLILSQVEVKINGKIPKFIKNRVIEEFNTNRKLIEEVINKCIKKRTL